MKRRSPLPRARMACSDAVTARDAQTATPRRWCTRHRIVAVAHAAIVLVVALLAVACGHEQVAVVPTSETDPDELYARCDRELWVDGPRSEDDLLAATRSWIDRFRLRSKTGSAASQVKAMDYALMLLDNVANLTDDTRLGWEEGRALFNDVFARQGASLRARRSLSTLLDLARDDSAKEQAVEVLRAYVAKVDDSAEQTAARAHLARLLLEMGRTAEGLEELRRARVGAGAEAAELRDVEREHITLAIGAEIPLAELHLDSGETLSATDYRGRWLWVEASSRACGPCRVERPAVEALCNWLQAQGVAVLSLCVRSPSGCPESSRIGNRVFASVGEPDGVYSALGLKRQPRNFLVGPDGRIRAKDLRGDAVRARWEALLSDSK